MSAHPGTLDGSESRLEATLSRHWQLWLVMLCVFAFLLTYLAPVDASLSDPWGHLLTAQAILGHGTIRLDRYVDDELYLYHPLEAEENGHYYNYFPLGTSLAALPAVALALLRGENMIYPDDNRELQNTLSSLTVVVCVLLVFALCRLYLPYAASFAWTVALIFGSTIVSTLGSALWSSNPALVLGLSTVLLLVVSDRRGAGWQVELALGLLLFSAYLCRPTMVLLSLLVVVYFYRRYQRLPITLVAVVATLFGFFLWFSSHEYGTFLPPYYLPSRLGESQFWAALYGHMLSPSRGLLIGSPFLLLILAGLLVWARRWAGERLLWLGVGWIVLHWLTVSSFHHWWGGWSFGNRLFTEALPAFILLALPVVRTARERLPPRARQAAIAAFWVSTAFAVFVHSHQGLYNVYSILWCDGIDQDESRVFDWRHPQFLATPGTLGVHQREHELLVGTRYDVGEAILPTSELAVFEGWSVPEGGGDWRWSTSRDPSILFKLEEPIPTAGRYVLEIQAGTYEPQEIQVSLNGVHIGVLRSDKNWEPATYRFPLSPEVLAASRQPLERDRIFELELEIPGALWVGEGSTRRLLGICFRRLTLRAEEL